MGIVIYNQPPSYSLAYNDNAYVMKSTNYTPTQRFKIVIVPSDYPISPELATVRVYPRQGITSAGVAYYDRAYFDPSRILQSVLQPNISIPSANHSAFFDCPTMHKTYRMLIYEEDKVGGVYVVKDSYLTNNKTVWNGVRNVREWLDFDYTDFVLSASSVDTRFLTDAPLTRWINSDQSAFLTFMFLEPKSVQLFIHARSENGSLLAFGIVEVNLSVNFQRIAVGTHDIPLIDPSLMTGATPSTILNGAYYYTVKAVRSTGYSETVRFNIDQKCTKYTPIRLHWLNRLGGFDCFNFNLKSEEETKIKRASYEQQHHTFTATSWDYTGMSRGQTDYDVQTTEMITVNTDFLTEDESVWMNDLVTSPVIYQELNNELIAVNIDERSIKKQTSLNDKLMQYTFDLEYSLRNMRQRG